MSGLMAISRYRTRPASGTPTRVSPRRPNSAAICHITFAAASFVRGSREAREPTHQRVEATMGGQRVVLCKEVVEAVRWTVDREGGNIDADRSQPGPRHAHEQHLHRLAALGDPPSLPRQDRRQVPRRTARAIAWCIAIVRRTSGFISDATGMRPSRPGTLASPCTTSHALARLILGRADPDIRTTQSRHGTGARSRRSSHALA